MDANLNEKDSRLFIDVCVSFIRKSKLRISLWHCTMHEFMGCSLTGRLLWLISELHSLTVGALVIKKHPQVVDTVRKLRKYVGPKDMTPEDLEKVKDEIEKIRLKAASIYVKIKSSFALPGKMSSL